MPKEQRIQHRTPNETRYLDETYHIVMEMKVSRVDDQAFPVHYKNLYGAFMKNAHPDQPKKYSSELYSLRFNRKTEGVAESKKVKVSFTGEIPQHLYERYLKTEDIEEREALALEYGKKALSQYLQIAVDELQVEVRNKSPEMRQLMVLAFQGGTRQAEQAGIIVNRHGFYLISDNYLTPYYPLGHGTNNGFHSVQALTLL